MKPNNGDFAPGTLESYKADHEKLSKLLADVMREKQALLEACKYALNWINDGNPKFDKMHNIMVIEEAIAKAEAHK